MSVVDSHHAQKLLGHGGGDEAGTAGGRDQTHADGSALAGHLSSIAATAAAAAVGTKERNGVRSLGETYYPSFFCSLFQAVVNQER